MVLHLCVSFRRQFSCWEKAIHIPPYAVRHTLEMDKQNFAISELNLIVLLARVPLVKPKFIP